MIFQSTIPGKTYVVRAAEPEYSTRGTPIKGSGISPLRAKFRGPQRLFDSAMAQSEHGWSDEERLQVESYLISHADFNAVAAASGVGAQSRVYLAHGQEVPPEHAEVYAATMERLASFGQVTVPIESGLPEPPRRCMAFETTEGELRQCAKLAALGSDLCEDEHVTTAAVGA